MACPAPQNAYTTRARWPERRFQPFTPGKKAGPASFSPFSANLSDFGGIAQNHHTSGFRHLLGAEKALSSPFLRDIPRPSK